MPDDPISRIRAEVAAAKKIAMANFERDWGTRDVRTVLDALRQTIPTSTSPADAAAKARKAVRS